MLSGELAEGVLGWLVEVTVNGVVREARTISWDGSIDGDLPDQVIAGGGISGVSGKIEWATSDPVSQRPASPWAKVAAWPPSSGDEVRIRVSDGVTWWTRFVGLVDDTTGDPTSGFASTIIDRRDQITGSFTHQALLRHMTPSTDGGAYRSIGLSHWPILVAALRSVGLCNVPPAEAPSAVSVPLQGTVWPEGGTLTAAQGPTLGTHASFYSTPWGYAAGGFTALYTPRLTEAPSTTTQITIVVGDSHQESAMVTVYYGTERIRLTITSQRSLVIYHNDGSSGWYTVGSLARSTLLSSTVITLLVKNGTWTVRGDGGAELTAARAVGTVTNLPMSGVEVDAGAGARIAGVQISHPTSSAREFASIGFTPSMRFTPSGLASTMDMSPAIRGRQVGDLVDEILKATLTAAWWDTEGVLRLVPSDQLRGGTVVQTITTADDITALSWEDSLLAVRSSVEVTWKDPLISKGKESRLELWRAAKDVLTAADDPLIAWASPDSGVEWFGVDRTLRRLNASNWGAYNLRAGSYCGVWLSNSSGDPATGDADVDITAETLYSDSLKITTNVVSLESGLEVNTSTHPEATALKEYLRNEALPVVRGRGRGEWVDSTYTTSAGPQAAPVLSHDLGYWGGEYFAGGSVAQRIGDYLATQVAAPQPTITNLGLIFDPRRELGDVITIRSEWIGVELRALIVGLSESIGGGATQSASVRVISATSTRDVTYSDLAAAWAPSNYTGLAAVWDALTYSDFVANPLEGAPS